MFNYVTRHEKEWIEITTEMIIADVIAMGDLPPTVFFLDSNNVQSTYSIDEDYDSDVMINHKIREMAGLLEARLCISCFMGKNPRLSKNDVLHILVHNPFFISVFVYDIYSEKKGRLLYEDYVVDSGFEGDFIHVFKEPFSAN